MARRREGPSGECQRAGRQRPEGAGTPATGTKSAAGQNSGQRERGGKYEQALPANAPKRGGPGTQKTRTGKRKRRVALETRRGPREPARCAKCARNAKMADQIGRLRGELEQLEKDEGNLKDREQKVRDKRERLKDAEVQKLPKPTEVASSSDIPKQGTSKPTGPSTKPPKATLVEPESEVAPEEAEESQPTVAYWPVRGTRRIRQRLAHGQCGRQCTPAVRS